MCIFSQRVFSELYICNYASVSQRALFVILELERVWTFVACLQLEQPASQLDDFLTCYYSVILFLFYFFFPPGWIQAFNTKLTSYSNIANGKDTLKFCAKTILSWYLSSILSSFISVIDIQLFISSLLILFYYYFQGLAILLLIFG